MELSIWMHGWKDSLREGSSVIAQEADDSKDAASVRLI